MKPMQNLKHVLGKDGYLTQHEQLQYHKDAVLRSMLFCENIENPQLSLPYKVSELNFKMYDKAFQYLKSNCKMHNLLWKHTFARTLR